MAPKKKAPAGGGKKGAAAAQKKAQSAAKQKVVEDKTFGLKNKNKSKKVQRFVQEVQQGQGLKKTRFEVEAEHRQRMQEKQRQEEAQLMKSLLAPVVRTKVPVGVDPKSRVCEFFKVGQCTKGDKCKFSHDMAVERKADKRSIHTAADGEGEDDERARKEADTMDSWDLEKLTSVIGSKQEQVNVNLQTKIVCKFFLKAVEESKYGWFWECPNGGKTCKYVHALPPGFVLKKKQADSDQEEENLEDILEEERAKLATHTPLTLETFTAWKKKKAIERAAEEEKRKQESTGGPNKIMRSGRQLFEFDKSLFEDDAMATDDYARAYSDDDEDVHEIVVTGTSLTRTTVKGRGVKPAADGPVSTDAVAASSAAPTSDTQDGSPRRDESAVVTGPIDASLFDEALEDLPSSDEE